MGDNGPAIVLLGCFTLFVALLVGAGAEGENKVMTVERHAIWCFQSDINQAMLEDCVDHQIFDIYVCIGYPNPAEYPSLTGVVVATEWGLQVSQAQITADLALLTSVDARLKLWAWAGTYGSGGHGATAYVDFTTAANRQALVNVFASIAGWGFYGWADDTEDYANSNTNAVNAALVEFLNLLGTTLHALGLKVSAYVPSVWHNFNTYHLGNIVNPDYIVTVPRMDSEANWNHDLDEAIANANVPLMLDMTAGGLEDQMDWYDTAGYTAFVGFALYSWSDGGGIGAGEWAAWDAWVPKDLADPPTTSDPTVTATLNVASIALGYSVSSTICSVTVGGVSGDGTGTVNFYVSADSGETYELISTETLAAGAASTTRYVPTAAGSCLFFVTYSGDANYNPAQSTAVTLTVTAVEAAANGDFNQAIAELEALNVGYTLIDYQFCEPGLADHTVFDEALEELENI